MVRVKYGSVSDSSTLQDSQVFKLDSGTTGIDLIPERTSVPTRRSISARSSPSLDDNEKIPHVLDSGQHNSDTEGELTVPVSLSPTTTRIYTSYTQSSDTPYTVIVRPKNPHADRPAKSGGHYEFEKADFESKTSSNDELEMLKERNTQLEKLQESDWALGLLDFRPPGLEKDDVAK
ncbi:hypothetical protein VKT23_015332 [Stygiomarasmius scandens]|uniref:Uncharacterized protein n=1 Tax=Marasmiellus scandens TaxID=2682957 RepID=A0ABR1J2L1_9AGAR